MTEHVPQYRFEKESQVAAPQSHQQGWAKFDLSCKDPAFNNIARDLELTTDE